MSFVAGVYSRSQNNPLQASELATIRKALQSGPTDNAGFVAGSRLHLAWVDMDGSVPLHDPAGVGEELLWGRLYLDHADERAARRLLRDECTRANPILGGISGDFGFAYCDASGDALYLVTDKLGVRPLFVHCSPDRVWFSSSLRVMERLVPVRKTMDERAVAEMAFFGWPLGDRTPYLGIRVLRPGERLRVDATREQSDYYWRWNTLSAWRGDRSGCVEELATRFRNSIRRRRNGDARVFSLLSGGLDSRMIATALREQGTRVVACNFSPEGTQDQVYSGLAGRALGCEYSSLPLAKGSTPNLYLQLSSAWREGAIASDGPIDHPHWVFVGVGGSTGFGAVFWDEQLIDFFRNGRQREGVEFFFRRMGWQLIERLYSARDIARMREALVEGVLEELRSFPCEDPARTFHLWEMMNDQRRHLHGHWENAASHGFQFHVPYFDSQFLECMLSVPLDWTLYHDLYYEWMQRFDAAARSVPWQVYPGHKPCPVPAVEGVPTQWEETGKYVLSERRTGSEQLRRLLATNPFPQGLRRPYLQYVRLRQMLGADYGYAIGVAQNYCDVWSRCEGRSAWR